MTNKASIIHTGMVAGAMLAASLLGGAAQAESKLPSQMVWTAYGTTSSGYAQSVAIGNMLKNKFGTSLRVLPGKNDVSRMTPLKTGKADFCACGIASYFGSEGVFLFAKKSWGPQPIRVVLTSKGSSGLGLGIAGDLGATSMADLKGKRVAFVRGGDALNVGAEAMLAFGGLTWDDVTKVEFPGYSASMEGVLNDQADAAFGSTASPSFKKIAASPRGLTWVTLDHKDDAAWKRLHTAAPYFDRHTATVGATLSKDKPWEGGTYAYPILVANAGFDAGVVTALAKAMDENYDDYKAAAPGAMGWAVSKQNFQWVLPYHDGAVSHFKKTGVWTDADQKHQDKLVKRQEILAATWKVFLATNPSKDGFKAGWMKARAAALEGAGQDPIFR